MQIFSKINGNHSVIMRPEVPNGYGIIIAGGSTGYVSENSSDFHEIDEKRELLQHLIEQGYTIGYCNHANKKHWGNPEAIKNMQGLHHVLVEQCNINPYVHVLGVSMGGVTCLNILASNDIPIMSTVLINPVLDLSSHRSYITKKEGIDRIGYEIAEAYNIPHNQVDAWFENDTILDKELFSCPCLVTHGDGDRAVRWQNNALVFTKLSLNCHLQVQLHIVKNAGHNDPKLLGDYTRIREFFQQSEPKEFSFTQK
ncbi:alpha-beta hydrolase superfamily lysophospholipase [Aneurinibacillus soli]|uniref:Alpha/beta hydrolase family protein n=1 Tax=Aneurinibacillus soli TaxID=1500254 RepID=A0A0U5BCC0_9BACL|nr:prolyl oligopeptidase family serine peptidase [Aneurinibacillus soli]PYE62239.1 alpha-beta hydrolase superfamily lysophospholipase [Aneurinibacillus soli]BAU28572.1 Alpha/beta hydrolase family protein [Aneurinibacillus soli]